MMSQVSSIHERLADVTEQKVEKSGCFSYLGRTFKKISDTVWQVAKISLLFGLVVNVPLLVAGNTITPPEAKPFRPFPDYMARFMNPGLQIARRGTAGCDTELILVTRSVCEQQTTNLLINLMTNKEDPRIVRFTEADLQEIYHEHGLVRYGAKADGSLIPFTFLIPPRKLENYEKAMQYAQDLLLKDANALQDSPESILKTLKTLHEILVRDLPESRNFPGGIYRDKSIKIVSTYKGHLTSSELAKKQLTAEEYAVYENTIARQRHKGIIDFITEEERTVWNKVFYIPIDYRTIESEMFAFAEELQQRMQQGGDYIDHASFAHAKLTRISPFPTAVGRLARLFANTILTIGELPAVVFNDHDRYAFAVRKGTNNREHFTIYLREQLEWTKKHMNIIKASSVAAPAPKNILDPTIQARYLFPGVQLVQGGSHGCVIESPPKRPLDCDQTITSQLGCAQIRDFISKSESADTFSEKGVVVTLPLDSKAKKLHFKVNPQIYNNYIAALKYVDELLAQNMQHFKQSMGKTIDTIQHIHKLLTQGLTNVEPITPGKFRTSWMIIDPQANPELIGVRARHVFTDEQFQIFAASYTKVQQDVSQLGRLTRQEAELWDRILYIPTSPNRIEVEMSYFAKYLFDRLTDSGQIDYIELASFVHTQIARIWAFTDANGRLARILMNAILRLGKLDPVVIYNEEAYIEAVDKGVRNQVVFTEYLRNRLIPWTQSHKETLGL